MPVAHENSHMYAKHLRHGEHTRRFEIREAGGVWEVQTLHDERVGTRVRYDDWHRVERLRLVFSVEIAKLEEAGWVPV